MPLAQALTHLHWIQAAMTSTSTPTGGPPCRGGGSRRTTTLTIPSPPSPVEDSVDGRAGTESYVEEPAGSLRQKEENGAQAHTPDFPCLQTPSSAVSAQDCQNKAVHSDVVYRDLKDSSLRELSLLRNKSELSEESSVPTSDSHKERGSSFTSMHRPSGEKAQQQAGVGLQESEIVPALKRRDSPKDRAMTGSSSSSSRTVSVSEHVETSADPRGDSKTSSVSSTFSDNHDDNRSTENSAVASTMAQTPAAVPKRRISFPADSVLTAVIQDGDTAELLRILTGRHGPGLVQTRGEGGALRGVDVCQSNHVGLTALHHAVLANNLDAAKLLLCYGADVNAQDVHGFSPLHTAAACGFLHLTSLLLLYGADVFAQTLENELPIDVAKELRVVRVLSAEMTRLLHQELWVTSLIRARAEEVWLLARKLLACVLLFVLHVCVTLQTLWRTRHRKAD